MGSAGRQHPARSCASQPQRDLRRGLYHGGPRGRARLNTAGLGELTARSSPTMFDLQNLRGRLKSGRDLWRGFFDACQLLPAPRAITQEARE